MSAANAFASISHLPERASWGRHIHRSKLAIKQHTRFAVIDIELCRLAIEIESQYSHCLTVVGLDSLKGLLAEP